MKRLPISTEASADDLRTTPFGHVLLELFGERLTGTLLVYADDDALRAAIRIEGGRPTAVLAAENGHRRVTDVLIPLCAEVEGRFEFMEGQDLVGSDGLTAAGPIDTLLMIMAAARDSLREDAVAQVMKLVSRSLIRLAAGLDLRRYGFSDEELLVLRELERGPMELEELRARAQVSAEILQRVLYVLRITRGITLSPLERSASGTVFHAPPLTTASTSPNMRARPPPSGVQSLRPATGTYSQRLAGAERQRPASGVHRNHPAVTPTRRPMERTSSPAPRSSQTPLPSRAPASGAPAPNDERAPKDGIEALWQQAKALSRRGQHEAALRTAHSAIRLGAPSPAREALLGWLIYQHGGGGEIVNPAVWKCLHHALKRDALCEEALYYKGLVLARTGQEEQAYAHFQRVLMLDPKHGPAQREIRIHDMRREHQRQQSGFLRRLLSSRPGPKSG